MWYRNYGIEIVKISNFGEKFIHKGQTPLSDCYKIRRGEGVPGAYPHGKLYGCGFKSVGLQAQKKPKSLIFGINLPKRGISP